MGIKLKRSKIRRIALLFLLLAVLAGVTFLYAHYIEPNQLSTKYVSIKTEGQAERSVKIAFFSDTHFGSSYSSENINRIAVKINERQPDIVIFGGDLIDSYWRDPPDTDQIGSGLKQIKAKYGKFAVYGNHDYGGGASKVYQKLMEQGGFEILVNNNKTIENLGINLIGMDDSLLGHPDLTIMDHQPKELFQFIISHSPDLLLDLEPNTINFAVAGHTHGGQIGIPFIRKWVLPQGGRKFVKGQYDLFSEDQKDKMILYVSSGIGTTQMKLRLFNIPEIIIFEVFY